MISEETRTALAYADIDLPTATELEVQRLVESVGGTYVNEEEAMIHVRDALIRHTDLKLSDFDVHIDDDSTKLKDAINPTTATFAEVTFALDGAAPTFTLAGEISTGTSTATVVAEEPAYFAVDANTGSVEEEPVVEEAAEAVEEEEAIEDTAEASEDVIDEDNRSDEDNDNDESSEGPSEDTGEAEDTAEASDTTDESEAPTDESIETAATDTEEDTAVSESTEAETETTADVEAADTTPSTADAVIVEDEVTTAAAESPSESSVVPLIEVEASDDETAELSTEPADYSVYPAGEGAEIAAATDELALAA